MPDRGASPKGFEERTVWVWFSFPWVRGYSLREDGTREPGFDKAITEVSYDDAVAVLRPRILWARECGIDGLLGGFGYLEEAIRWGLNEVPAPVRATLDLCQEILGPESCWIGIHPRWFTMEQESEQLHYWNAEEKRWRPNPRGQSNIFNDAVVKKTYLKVLERDIEAFGGHPALVGFMTEDWAPISNPISLNAWLMADPERWREYLARRYGDVETLCEVWRDGENYYDHALRACEEPPYRSFDEVEPVELPEGFRMIKEGDEANVVCPPQLSPVSFHPGIRGAPVLDYREFMAESHRHYFELLCDCLHGHGLKLGLVTGWEHENHTCNFGNGFHRLDTFDPVDCLCIYTYYCASSLYDSMHAMLNFKTITTSQHLRHARESCPDMKIVSLLEGRMPEFPNRGGSASARQAHGYLLSFLGLLTGYFPFHRDYHPCCFDPRYMEYPLVKANNELHKRLHDCMPPKPQIRITHGTPEGITDLQEYYRKLTHWLINTTAPAGLLSVTGTVPYDTLVDDETRLLIVHQDILTAERVEQIRRFVEGGGTLLFIAPSGEHDEWRNEQVETSGRWRRPAALADMVPMWRTQPAERDTWSPAGEGPITCGVGEISFACRDRVRLNPETVADARVWLAGEGGAVLVQSGEGVFTLATSSRKTFTAPYPTDQCRTGSWRMEWHVESSRSHDSADWDRITGMPLDETPDGCEGIESVRRLLRNIARAAGVRLPARSQSVEVVALGASGKQMTAAAFINTQPLPVATVLEMDLPPGAADPEVFLNSLPFTLAEWKVCDGVWRLEWELPGESTLIVIAETQQ